MADVGWIDETLERLKTAQITAQQRGILIEGMEEEIDKLIAENQRLRAELEALHPQETDDGLEGMSMLRPTQEDRGVPILGEVRDGKVSWLGVDTAREQE